MKEYQIGDYVYIAWGKPKLRVVCVFHIFIDEDEKQYVLRAPSGVEGWDYYVRDFSCISDNENGPLNYMKGCFGRGLTN